MMNDTIAAIATGRGRAAIGIVRVSGPAVRDLACALLGELPPARRAHHCHFRAADGSSLDSGIALYSQAPATYTGEDTLELQGHGGGIVLDAVLERTLELGARTARPGEFTERAYLNGKIDLAQAEAVAALVDSTSRMAAQAAMRTLDGELSRLVNRLAESLLALRIEIEAYLDFTEEDAVVDLDRESFAGRLRTLQQQLVETLGAAQPGVRLREGVRVALAGPPNSGKSTLMNRLANRDVAITSAQPGTTRDALTERIEIGGVAVELYDLAGLREDSEDPIEQEGMRRAPKNFGTRRSHPLAHGAGGGGATAIADRSGDRRDCQQDRPQRRRRGPAAAAGAGRQRRQRGRGQDSPVGPEGHWHRRVAGPPAPAFCCGRGGAKGPSWPAAATLKPSRRFSGNWKKPRKSLATNGHRELVAERLRLAHEALGSITGAVRPDDLLGEIFAAFCIGK